MEPRRVPILTVTSVDVDMAIPADLAAACAAGPNELPFSPLPPQTLTASCPGPTPSACPLDTPLRSAIWLCAGGVASQIACTGGKPPVPCEGSPSGGALGLYLAQWQQVPCEHICKSSGNGQIMIVAKAQEAELTSCEPLTMQVDGGFSTAPYVTWATTCHWSILPPAETGGSL
jgi:hypothetical protein